MSAADKPIEKPIEPRAQFVLGAIKAALFRLDEIRQELVNAGLALKAGYVTPQMALDWCEEFAPGCVGYIPPLTGLGLKRHGGVEC
jgi:hypothetical protein